MPENLTASIIAGLIGIVLIITGIKNIKTQTAQESGKRILTNKLLGHDNTYTGKKAAMVGKTRIIMGICCIIFAVVIFFTGPFLTSN
jgi:hypothetical protein